MFPEQIRKPRLPVGEKKIIRFAVEISECLGQALAELFVLDDGTLGKGQCVISRFRRFLRRKVEHAIVQAFVCACAAIVNFIGMQNDDISRHAEMRCAAIGKGLDAGKRDAECIGVMAMRRIGIAVKASVYTLYAFAGWRLDNPFEFARTFKIADAPRR